MPELYSTNSVGLRFREIVEKIKEGGKKTNLKNPTKQAGKIWREKTRAYAHQGQNFKNFKISTNFSLKSL